MINRNECHHELQPLEILELSGQSETQIQVLIDCAKNRTQAKASFYDILTALHSVGELWHKDSHFYQSALQTLSQEM